MSMSNHSITSTSGVVYRLQFQVPCCFRSYTAGVLPVGNTMHGFYIATVTRSILFIFLPHLETHICPHSTNTSIIPLPTLLSFLRDVEFVPPISIKFGNITSKNPTRFCLITSLNMPLDHFGIVVPQAKLEGVVTFLLASLQHLGFKEHMRPIPTVVGLGDAMPFMWITGADHENGDTKTQEELLKKSHIAFTAESQSNCIGYPSFTPQFASLLSLSYNFLHELTNIQCRR
jgi:hypothetical protein